MPLAAAEPPPEEEPPEDIENEPRVKLCAVPDTDIAHA